MRSNGMRHVDQPALAADLGDRLLQRHPARDLLLDEEPDHLALVGGLDLLGHDHLDPVGALARLERARDLVVVGDRDRAEPDPRGGVEQRVHRRGAVRRVVGVHVQVDVDEVALGSALAAAPVLPLPWRRAAISSNSASNSSATRDHSSSGWAAAMRGPKPRDQLGPGDQPLELGGERERVARLEQQAELALAQRLLVLGQARHHRHGAAGQRAQHELRRRRGAGRGGHGDRGARQVLGLRAVAGPGQPHPLAQPARQARPPAPRPGRAARSWRASRGRWTRGAARAGTAAARRAPPRPRTRSPAARRRCRGGGAGRPRAGSMR